MFPVQGVRVQSLVREVPHAAQHSQKEEKKMALVLFIVLHYINILKADICISVYNLQSTHMYTFLLMKYVNKLYWFPIEYMYRTMPRDD